MLNIMVKDLEMCKELDKKATKNIFGGSLTLKKIDTICVGTFLNSETGEIKQRYRDLWEATLTERYYGEAYDTSMCCCNNTQVT